MGGPGYKPCDICGKGHGCLRSPGDCIPIAEQADHEALVEKVVACIKRTRDFHWGDPTLANLVISIVQGHDAEKRYEEMKRRRGL